MSNTDNATSTVKWNSTLLLVFRILFVYFLIQIIPLDPKFYKAAADNNLPGLHYGDIFNFAHYYPSFFFDKPSFADWAVYLVIAVIGGLIWTFADKKTTSPDTLYYWFRVILRYRLAIALIAYGFIKFYPLQSPYPSISNLNTSYGDFTRWKLFGMSLGIVPSYQSFLGGVEIVVGLFLLYRKTASLAAFVVIIFTGNVLMSNIAYEGGETVYCLFLLSLAFFILLYDLQRIISLLILQKATAPNRYKPLFFQGWKHYARLSAKLSFIIFFVVIYGFKTRSGYLEDKYQYPREAGVAELAGLYDVTTFALNRDTIAYSKFDPVRWSDLVFEKWNTISIRSNRPVITDSTNTDRVASLDKDRSYEYEGTGGRHYYSYKADTANNQLILTNRNPHYAGEKLVLTYERKSDSTIVLSGSDHQQLPVYAVLQKVNKKYLLEEVARRGRRKSFKL